MEFLFLPSDPRTGAAGELMSSVSKSIKSAQLIGSSTAANADELGEGRNAPSQGIESTGGWDAYEVWRRFIKDARDRRKHPDSN